MQCVDMLPVDNYRETFSYGGWGWGGRERWAGKKLKHMNSKQTSDYIYQCPCLSLCYQ